jgi:hypothetical protein
VEDARVLGLHQGISRPTDRGCSERPDHGRGRAIFGRRIDTPWSYYGFLSLPQVRTLHAALATLQDDDPSLRGEPFMDGFLDELMGWLQTVESNNQDLWFYCA